VSVPALTPAPVVQPVQQGQRDRRSHFRRARLWCLSARTSLAAQVVQPPVDLWTLAIRAARAAHVHLDSLAVQRVQVRLGVLEVRPVLPGLRGQGRRCLAALAVQGLLAVRCLVAPVDRVALRRSSAEWARSTRTV